MENMDYNANNDTYCCRNEQILAARYEKKKRKQLQKTVTVYQ